MIYFQDLTRAELSELLLPLSRVRGSDDERPAKARKQAQYRAKQIFHWVYQRYVLDWNLMSDLSKEVRAWLAENVQIHRPESVATQQAEDGTHKFLWKLSDKKTVESVVIPALKRGKSADIDDEEGLDEEPAQSAFAGAPMRAGLDSEQWSRLTACISSQVGCAMACGFCLTGIQGFDRNLETHEIVSQVLELRRLAPISNIVFMGMGEPLHNYENVAKACEILLDPDGLHFSKRKVTVSTSGIVPQIAELGKRTGVSLAVSLNATTDEQRSQIMPVNRKWNIAALLEACREYPTNPFKRITFEYVMIRDFNDSVEDAQRLSKLLRGIPSKINLIPLNEHPGSDLRRPDDATIQEFKNFLGAAGYTVTVRISRGRDILAACGQLRSLFGTAKGTEKHRDFQARA